MLYLCHMMRILSVVLLLGVLLQTCSKQLIYTDYLVNKDFVASVLCVNKDVPENHCEGKCHLKKQLDQDTQQQEGSKQKSKSGSEVVFLAAQSVVLTALTPIATPHYFNHRVISSNVILDAVFHPPGMFLVS